MRYFENIITGALVKDFITPAYPAYWKEISKKEYEKKYKEFYKQGLTNLNPYAIINITREGTGQKRKQGGGRKA